MRNRSVSACLIAIGAVLVMMGRPGNATAILVPMSNGPESVMQAWIWRHGHSLSDAVLFLDPEHARPIVSPSVNLQAFIPSEAPIGVESPGPGSWVQLGEPNATARSPSSLAGPDDMTPGRSENQKETALISVGAFLGLAVVFVKLKS